MAYRVNYVDSARSPQLVAVAEALEHARSAMRFVATSLPELADRLQIAEDPLLGSAPRVVQPPENLDTPGGLSVLYLGGTMSADRNWQARAVASLIAHPVVIVSPRREQPLSQDEVLVQVAWPTLDYRVAAIGLYERGGRTDLFGPALDQAGCRGFPIRTLSGADDPLSIQAIWRSRR